MAATEQLKKLVDQLPAADRRGMYLENIDREQIEKTVQAIAEGGAENVLGLIELLGEPGSKESVKPQYALHCVVNQSLIAKDEKQRKSFCEAIASQLENKSLHPYNRAVLCQELQWAGRDESCPALGKVLLDEEMSDAAATALAAIGGERAASQLQAAAAKAQGKTLLNLLDALAALAAANSADLFRQAMRNDDREVRIAAAAGLANLGQAESAEELLKAAAESAGWERTQLTRSCLVLAEKIAASGNKESAQKIYRQLQKSHAGESHILQAADRGLAAIG